MLELTSSLTKIGHNKRHSVGISPSTTLMEGSGLNFSKQRQFQRQQKRSIPGSSPENMAVAGMRRNTMPPKNNAYGIDNDKNRGSG